MIALNDAFQPESGRVTDAERRALTDPDVIEETRRLRALGLGPVESLRIAARSVRQSLAPAGRVALASPAKSPPSYSERCAPAGALSCTGAPAQTGADASAACLLPPPPSGSPAATAPVSPHAAPTGGAGTSPVIEQGDAAHRGPVRNAERTSKPLSGVHAMGSARGASAAEPALGRSPARSLPLTDDGMAWGESAPARRRLHPLAYLALLLAASWLALIALAAVEAVRALFLRP